MCDQCQHVGSRAQQETDSPQRVIRVLLDTGSSGDLLFMKKGSTTCIPVVRRAVPESWGTSNGTFQTKKVTSKYPLWTTRTAKGFT